MQLPSHSMWLQLCQRVACAMSGLTRECSRQACLCVTRWSYMLLAEVVYLMYKQICKRKQHSTA